MASTIWEIQNTANTRHSETVNYTIL